MNKSDLVLEVARAAGLTREASESGRHRGIRADHEALVKGERVELRGLGTFEVRQRAAHAGRNPKTGAPSRSRPGRSRSSGWGRSCGRS